MEVKTIVTVNRHLHLTEEEAEWLHAAMQNPINSFNPETESPADKEMRARFWNATRPS